MHSGIAALCLGTLVFLAALPAPQPEFPVVLVHAASFSIENGTLAVLRADEVKLAFAKPSLTMTMDGRPLLVEWNSGDTLHAGDTVRFYQPVPHPGHLTLRYGQRILWEGPFDPEAPSKTL